MSALALLNVFSYVDGYDFTGDSNETRMELDRVPLDKTNFRSNGWTELVGGMRSVAFAQAGHWQAGAGTSVDSEGFNKLGTRDRLHTFGPEETEGSVAYFWRSGHFQYNAFDAGIGELAPFSLNGQGSDAYGVIRGVLAAAPYAVTAGVGAQVVTSTLGALGTAVQLGAVSADQHLYAGVHILADVGAGDDITLTIESDADDTFATPTVQATIGPLSARGGTWVTPVAGAITDTWWRFVVDDITATTSGQFVIAAAFGIQGGWL